MTTLNLCDNCNADNGTIMARIVIGSDPVIDSSANQRWPNWLCFECVEDLRRLRFGSFEERHRNRRREMKLP